MRTSTRILQLLCAVLGAVFSLFGVFSAGSSQGGLLLGAFMFMAALMLGTDSSTNPGSASRQFYKAALLLVTFTFGCVVAGALWRLADERRWLDVLLAGLKLAVVVLAVMAVMLGNHPRVRRVLGALGFRP